MIGAGHFSNVYSNGRNVVKVYRSDPAYEKFLGYVEHHPSPHFPKVLSAPRTLEGTDLKVVQLERLQPISNENWHIFDTVATAVWLDEGDFDNKDDFSSYQTYLEEHPEYTSLANTIRGLRKVEGVHEDMKMENILQRADGTIVISDPFC